MINKRLKRGLNGKLKMKLLFPCFLLVTMGKVPHGCALSHSHVPLFATPWSILHQAPLPMGFSRQEYWSGLLYPPPGDLPDAGIKPPSLTSLALAGRFLTISTTWEAHCTA